MKNPKYTLVIFVKDHIPLLRDTSECPIIDHPPALGKHPRELLYWCQTQKCKLEVRTLPNKAKCPLTLPLFGTDPARTIAYNSWNLSKITPQRDSFCTSLRQIVWKYWYSF